MTLCREFYRSLSQFTSLAAKIMNNVRLCSVSLWDVKEGRSEPIARVWLAYKVTLC